MTLRVDVAAAEPSSSTRASDRPVTSEVVHPVRLNVLLVDDRPEHLLALEAILADLGQNLVRARSGKDALRQLLERDFAVILLDVQMPIVDGFETAELIRRRERSRDTPIIFLTGVERADAQMFRGYSLGAVDYVLKPVIPAVIRAKVGVFIELARKTTLLKEQGELLRKNHSELVELTNVRARLLEDLEISTTLAGSLDLVGTLTRVSELAAGRLADWCMVDIVDEAGQIREAVSSHSAPACLEAVQLLQVVLGLHPRTLAGRVLESGVAEFVDHVTPRMLAEEWGGDETAEMILACGLGSAASVPLIARGRTIGVMTLGCARHWPRDRPPMLELAEEFAQRAALAIDNARLYRAAEDAIQARDDFLCVASHELRTPLTPLKLHIEALRRATTQATEISPERLLERVGKMDRQCTRLERLVDHLLDVSRISAQTMKLELEAMDLVETVREIVEQTRDEAGSCGPEIRFAVTEPVWGSWDRLRVEQVVSHLLSNAMKYGAGEPIDVSVVEEPGVVRLLVKDRGGGIPAGQQERIFGRFERAASTRNAGGLGLGLWIVNQIAAAHGGVVRVDSKPNAGATFSFELPKPPPPPEGSS
jgi:signal transduction histidine kinase/CheY-like chemotaxis protein